MIYLQYCFILYNLLEKPETTTWPNPHGLLNYNTEKRNYFQC